MKKLFTVLLILLVIQVLFSAPANAENVANEIFMKQSSTAKLSILSKVVRTADYPCYIGVSYFYKGNDGKDAAYWAIKCSGGDSYLVKIPKDPYTNTRVTPCSVLRTVGVKCFEKFPGW